VVLIPLSIAILSVGFHHPLGAGIGHANALLLTRTDLDHNIADGMAGRIHFHRRGNRSAVNHQSGRPSGKRRFPLNRSAPLVDNVELSQRWLLESFKRYLHRKRGNEHLSSSTQGVWLVPRLGLDQ
jgi:hypothetical protein